jgi:glucose dehydrogenase
MVCFITKTPQRALPDIRQSLYLLALCGVSAITMQLRMKAMMLGMMAVLTLTALSGAAPVAAAPSPSASASASHNSLAASSSTAGANWAFVDDSIAATNWSNQTQITAANAASMQVDWVVPFPNVDLTWKQAPGASWSTEPGSSAPPLIVNGIV